MGFPFPGKKGKALLSAQTKAKGRFPTAPGPGCQLETLQPRSARRKQGYFWTPGAFEKQVLIPPAALIPSLGLQSSLRDFGWKVPCPPCLQQKRPWFALPSS